MTLCVGAGINEFDEADFLNSVSLTTAAFGVVCDDVDELFDLFDCTTSCDLVFDGIEILFAGVGDVVDCFGCRGDRARGIRTFL